MGTIIVRTMFRIFQYIAFASLLGIVFSLAWFSEAIAQVANFVRADAVRSSCVIDNQCIYDGIEYTKLDLLGISKEKITTYEEYATVIADSIK